MEREINSNLRGGKDFLEGEYEDVSTITEHPCELSQPAWLSITTQLWGHWPADLLSCWRGIPGQGLVVVQLAVPSLRAEGGSFSEGSDEVHLVSNGFLIVRNPHALA